MSNSHIPNPTTDMNGSNILLYKLNQKKVSLITGYIGGAIMPTFDALNNYPNIRFIMTRHEQGAGFLAQGYTRACGQIAPVLVTSGPGATNIITAVADAKMDSVKMFCITGQVGTGVLGTEAFQESDIIGMVNTSSKSAKMPTDATQIESLVDQLWDVANIGKPGPVLIDVPKNVQVQTVTKGQQDAFLESEYYTQNKIIQAKINKEKQEFDIHLNGQNLQNAVDLINNSKRPVVLVGHGIILDDCQKELLAFIEKGYLPSAMTLHGLSSVPASHPLSLSMMGMYGEIPANRAVQNADLIIALGMRFDDRVTGKTSEYAKKAKVIHIEIDKKEFGKNIRVDVPLIGRLKNILPVLTQMIDRVTDRPEYMVKIQNDKLEAKYNYRRVYESGVGAKDGQLLMARVMADLSEVTAGQDLVVADVGSHQMFAAKFYQYEKFNSYFTSGGLGSMGFCLPASLGVKLGRPNETVWSVNGDGGFQMNIQELGTILQEKIDIKILLLNNSFLGMVKEWQDFLHDKRYVQTRMINPDFGLLVKSYGIPYKKITTVDQIKPALEWAKNYDGAVMLEFICEEYEPVLPILLPGGTFDDFIETEEQALARIGVNEIDGI